MENKTAQAEACAIKKQNASKKLALWERLAILP